MEPRPTPAWLAVLLGSWPFVLAGGSAWWRRRRGVPSWFFGVPGALFQERFVSGRSSRGAWWWLGFNNALVVSLADGRLTLRPFFPFTLMFLPELLGFEFDVPVSDVEFVDVERRWLHEWTRIRIARPGAPAREVSLRIRAPELFERTLRSMQGAAR